MTRCTSEFKKGGPRCLLPVGHQGTHYNGSLYTSAETKQLVRGAANGPDSRAKEWS